jgi:hypothetical protein
MFTMKKSSDGSRQTSSGKSQMRPNVQQHSGRSITPGTSLSGVTKVQHREWKDLEREHHRQTQTAAEASSQARDMLETMMQPKEGNGPQEMTEIMNGIAAILTRLDRIEAHLKSRQNA